ncbi:tail fiber protein [Akkermansia glycaniphila]|uniref:Tail fiber protein n=2 Tax=Akkermansia glycaniphila TaxID=1679444 RepID=A0A1H6MDQ6_9BACT|nr:tail fiber protein [Akkermansia glycaniphila]
MMQDEDGLTLDVPFLNLRAEDVEKAVNAAREAEASAVRSGESAAEAAGSAGKAADSATAAKQALDDFKARADALFKEFEKRVNDAVDVATNRAETAANAAGQSAVNAASMLSQCQAIKAEILQLIETGAVGDAITAATGNILEEILTDARLTNRFVAAMSGSGVFVLINNLGRALTVNPLGMVDVDLSNYSGTVVSINGTTSATVKSGTTASLTLSAGSAALYGGTSASITHTNDNSITLYNYGGSTGNICSTVTNTLSSRAIRQINLAISDTESGSNKPLVTMSTASNAIYHPTKNTATPAFTLV